jgi:hypothetical protein
MKLSRRTLLGAAVAGTAATAAGVSFDAFAADTAAPTASAVSPPGDVVGKITVGYQGWFTAAGDGAPLKGWWHYGQDWQQIPSPVNQALKSWPDVRDYDRVYKTGYQNLGDGRPASLFSSYDQQTVDTHFRWMRENNLDTAALQRFNPVGGEGPIRDAVTVKVRNAAEQFGRKFYIMYDVSGWTDMQQQIKDDWAAKMNAYTASPAYARQNGKPVVGIWGFGFNDTNHPWNAAACLDVITWFQTQGVYVMGGTPTHWRNGDSDSRSGFSDVYHAFDMISPWMVGRIGDAAGSDWFHTNVTVPDVRDCLAHGIDYQPCVLPGDLQERQRAHGDFMWRQFYNVIRAGAPAIYISMFDEYNEGNQIAKTAETAASVPAGSKFLALDEDGTKCSADYYLRLSGDGGRMLKGELALTATRPTVPAGGTAQPPEGTEAVGILSRANDRFVGGSPLTASLPSATERFTVVDAGAGLVALRSSRTGKYVCADQAGTAALVADRDSIGAWETFTKVQNPDGSVSFRSSANGRYVCAENAGTGALIANRTAIGPWESFDLV